MQLNPKTLEKLRLLINEETEYRSGPKLISFFNELGFQDSYGQGFPSRWFYTDEKLASLNGTSDIDTCIKKLFSPINFINRINDLDNLITNFNQYLAFDKWQVIRDNDKISFIRMDKIEIKSKDKTEQVSEAEFLRNEFKNVNIEKIGLDCRLTDILKLRLIEKCIKSNASLSVLFLCGSTLEGILLGLTAKHPSKFNQVKSAPKDKEDKIKLFHEWTLNDFINTAYELGFINEDVKKFSHSLRDFRNYIHPYQQLSSGFNPDEHTTKISWQVLKAAIYQIGAFYE